MVQSTIDDEIITKWQERIKRGFLWVTVLRLYDKYPTLSGTDIKDVLSNMHHLNWDPSPGSIYPVLKQLVDDGLITQVDESEKKLMRPNKVYKLTERGSKLLVSLQNDVFAFRTRPLLMLRRMGSNEKVFNDLFHEMVKDLTTEEMDEVFDNLTRVLHWLEVLIEQSKSTKG